jgi:aerobic-type carbon monoxide dehydrogenase small subunit (CoxS/CutS family)
VVEITLDINENRYQLPVESHWTLLDVLRDRLGLTGAKKGCGRGECGACTVLVDGVAVQSCLVLAVQVHGKSVTTIEGLTRQGLPDPLQVAFHEAGAIQCGFCTPGMILSARSLLDRCPHPTELQVKEALSGNLCRCTGYVKIVEAVMRVASGSSHASDGGTS